MSTKHQNHFNASLESLTVSQEGIVDAIKRLFAKKASGPKKPEIDWNTVSRYDDEWSTVERALANSNAINALTLKTGEIDGATISLSLLGTKTSVSATEAAIQRHIRLLPKIINDMRHGVKTLAAFQQKLAEILQTNPNFDVLKACAQEGYKKLNPCKITPQEYKELLPATDLQYYDEYQSWMYSDGNDLERLDKLPALTHEDIKRFAKVLQAIRKVLDKPDGDIGAAVIWGPYNGDRKPLEAVFEAVDGVDGPAECLFSVKLADEYGWANIPRLLFLALEEAEDALVTWIYRSIEN